MGQTFKSNDIKLYAQGTWKMKLAQLARQRGRVRIITYSLPGLKYIKDTFERRPSGIFIICHSKFKKRARSIIRTFPDIKVRVNSEVHSKVCLIEPATIYIGSANFGSSGWHETNIGIRSKQMHDWYIHSSYTPLWQKSKTV